MSDQESPTAEGTPGVFKFDGSRLNEIALESIEAYNFRSPGFLNPVVMDQLRAMHLSFAQQLAARLATFLRMECSLTISKFDNISFAEFSGSINDPAHLTLFQMEPLHGIAILDLGVKLALAITDRILGGKAQAAGAERNLTEIELALLEDVVAIILKEWSLIWKAENAAFHPKCIGCETSARFLQTSSPDAVIVVVAMEVMLGENIEQMQIGFPFLMVEPLIKKVQGPARPTEEVPVKTMQWRSPFNAIEVPVTAEWRVGEMSVRDVIALEPGSFLPMSSELLKQTRVRFGDKSEFIGTIGVKSGFVAVQLTEKNHGEGMQ